MDTVRVDICYRPLRIGWAIREGDMAAFREAVRLSHTLWGGRFNPIVVVEREEEAKLLVDLFHVDLVCPIGDTDDVNNFPKLLPHLISPFFSGKSFREATGNHVQVLDVQNAIAHLRETPKWKAINDMGFRIYAWQADDPLADVLLVQLGKYPSPQEHGINYEGTLLAATYALQDTIDPASPIQADIMRHPTISYLSTYGLERHSSMPSAWNSPGFFIGDAACFDDLVFHWNLRAADIHLLFVDPYHFKRYERIIVAWENVWRERSPYRQMQLAIWSRSDDYYNLPTSGDIPLVYFSRASWNGHGVRPPMMHFGQVSTLGVIGRGGGKPKVSFQLANKPFCGDVWFHSQHLVASVSFITGLYGDEQYTLNPPFVPELNEFYARAMHLQRSRLRIEPERLGLVVDAADTDTFVYAVPVADLIEKLFHLAGFAAKLSQSGLILRQLIAQLGGLRDAIVFRIPGVRRLLKQYGPTKAFTKSNAVQLIGGEDPGNPGARFDDYTDLYIERRLPDSKLTPLDVFAHLVEKGLFRIGAQLKCPTCHMTSWTALDALKQTVVCDLCGSAHDATRQLVNGEWYYRRSGVLGAERNSQGAVPVALTLHQLERNLSNLLHEHLYSPSLDLESLDADQLKCETDFVWIIAQRYPSKTVVILGECKDRGAIDSNDVDNLRRVADAFPSKRFDTFVLLAKLCPFTEGEIETAMALNSQSRSRAILLTARELEPDGFFDRIAPEFNLNHASRPEDLALATTKMYFKNLLPSDG